jgi:thiosulfate/3-mercaptopyruvate sulfurtransferase
MADALLPLIVEPDALEAALGAENLLVVDLNEAAMYAQGHIPGAVNLPYASLIGPRPPAMGTIARPEQLSAALSGIGLTPDHHVVACDGEGTGKASRFLWTLDVIGHQHFSLLDGGLHSWAAEGHKRETTPNVPTPSDYRVTIGTDHIAGRDYILAHLDDPNVVVLDARTAAEYAGGDVRAARGGHIPGAVNLDWTMTLDRDRNMRLRPKAELTALLEERGITPDKEVIAHCQTHHRSSQSYIMLKSLGFTRIRGYDGSWSEWGNDPDLPVES